MKRSFEVEKGNAVFDLIEAMFAAEIKHPVFATSEAGGLAVISEEYLELTRAINDGESRERKRSEALDVAVTAIRFCEMLDKEAMDEKQRSERDEKQFL